jgi:hypothetical protein
MAALIRGATIETILDSCTCEGTLAIRDALVIPTALNEALVDRLGRTANELQINWQLYNFLSYRASDSVFLKAVRQYPELLERQCWQTDIVADSPQLAARARAHRLGLLSDELRENAALRLEDAALRDLDVSFFKEDEMLLLIPPVRLINLGLAIRTRVLPALAQRIDDLTADADLDEDPDGHFKKLVGVVDHVAHTCIVDDEAAMLIDEARTQVRRSIELLEERKRQRDEDDSEIDWSQFVTQKKETAASRPIASTRSVFDDVDR